MQSHSPYRASRITARISAAVSCVVTGLWTGSLALGLAAAFTGCGLPKPHVEKQPRDTVLAPAYPQPTAGQGLALMAQPSASESRFQGPVIVWRSQLAVKDMAEVVQAKVRVLDADLAYKKSALVADELQQRLVRTQDAIAKNKQTLDTKLDLAASYRRQAATLSASAKDWLAQQVTTAAAEKAWGQFCQARLWDFLPSVSLRERLYSQRPSPLGLCEPYYAAHGYFTAAACQPASSPQEGKNYTACFWGPSGVAKTEVQFFDGLTLEVLAGADLAELYALFATEQWQQSLGAKDDLALNGMLTVSEGLLGSPGDKTYLLDFVAPFTQSLSQVLAEAGFLEASATEVKAQLQALVATRESFAEVVVERQKYNFNDMIFNLPYQQAAPALRMQDKDLSTLLDLSETASQLFGKVLSSEDRANIAELKTTNDVLNQQKEDLAAVAAAYKNDVSLAEKSERWTHEKSKLANFIYQQDMAQAFWPAVALSLQRRGDLVLVYLKLDNQAKAEKVVPALGCYSAEAFTPVVCPEAAFSEGAVPLMVAIDQVTGLLALELVQPSASNFYMDPIAREEKNIPYFQEANLTRKALAAMRVRFELMPGKHAHELPLFTGKVFLYTGSLLLAEGSVNLTKSTLVEG